MQEEKKTVPITVILFYVYVFIPCLYFQLYCELSTCILGAMETFTDKNKRNCICVSGRSYVSVRRFALN